MLTNQQVLDRLEWLKQNPDHPNWHVVMNEVIDHVKETNPRKYGQFLLEAMMKLGIR